MSKPVFKHPLTDNEREAIKCLEHVGMPCGCWDKRFRRDVLSPALQTGVLGEKSVPQLWRLFMRYRRQINHPRKSELLKLAEKWSAPDFRKINAAAREQARIDELKEKFGLNSTGAGQGMISPMLR